MQPISSISQSTTSPLWRETKGEDYDEDNDDGGYGDGNDGHDENKLE